MKKELVELYKLLVRSLKEMGLVEDSITAIALLLKSEAQILTMLDYIMKHNQENPLEDEVIKVAQKISEQVS